MNTNRRAGPNWYTSSMGGSTDTSQHELSALKEHLKLCHSVRGRWFNLHRHTDTLLGFMATRIVTTLVLVALLVGLAWLL